MHINIDRFNFGGYLRDLQTVKLKSPSNFQLYGITVGMESYASLKLCDLCSVSIMQF